MRLVLINESRSLWLPYWESLILNGLKLIQLLPLDNCLDTEQMHWNKSKKL